MRRLLVLALLSGCFLAAATGSQAAPPPAPKVSLSDSRPSQGERVTVWFQWPGPNQLVRIYLDSPSHGLPRVTTSATGHGSQTFTVWSGFAPGTAHYVVLSSSGGIVKIPFVVSPPGVHYDRWADERTTPGTGEEIFEPDPSRTIGDVTETRSRHGASTVRIVTYYRGLPREGRKYLYLLRIKTPSVERHITIATQHGNWAGTLTFTKPGGEARAATTVPADEPVSCAGITFLIDYSHRRSIVTVPRACLRSPAYVRVGSAFFSSQSNTVESYDDAFDTRSDPLANEVTLSPALHR